MGRRNCPLENLVTSQSFWLGRRVLVTGHTGFKGSWMSLMLQRLGAEVAGFALAPPTSSPALFELARVGGGMESRFGDIRDLDQVSAFVEEVRPEIVIHMAAQALVRESYESPVETYATNVMGSVHVLEAVRGIPQVRAVLNVTSDKCYENNEWAWPYRETDRLGGADPYSSSKGCAELVTSAYARSFLTAAGVAVATARAGNVIGGGDWAKDRIVPDAIDAFTGRKPLVVRNPQAVRPWQHVLEPLTGYLRLCELMIDNPSTYSQAWNFGPAVEDVQPVGRVAEMLCARWGNGASWTASDSSEAHEARLLRLDSSAARAELGWRPTWNFSDAIERTVEWYKAWAADGDVRELTLAQTDEYQTATNELSNA